LQSSIHDTAEQERLRQWMASRKPAGYLDEFGAFSGQAAQDQF
jgi:hypothetical protein